MPDKQSSQNQASDVLNVEQKVENTVTDIVKDKTDESLKKSVSPSMYSDKLSSTGVDKKPKELNGPKGLEPTRYGDWEAKGRCYDF